MFFSSGKNRKYIGQGVLSPPPSIGKRPIYFRFFLSKASLSTMGATVPWFLQPCCCVFQGEKIRYYYNTNLFQIRPFNPSSPPPTDTCPKFNFIKKIGLTDLPFPCLFVMASNFLPLLKCQNLAIEGGVVM